MKKIPYAFECEPYGDFTSITPLISKGRLRVYYKGLNRNGGFITDEFSSKLEASLPYTPIVGEYDKERQDFKSHNQDRNAAAIYGLVPENPNISWEPHLDRDGVERTYLCCDVYLYSGRYDAANNIIGKHHSMELNRSSLQGNWERRGLSEVFVYTDAYFDGLCVLGDGVEPCFEGSGFFSHETGAIKILEDYVRNKTNKIEDTSLGGNTMEEDKILDFAAEPEIEEELEAEEVEVEAEAEASEDFEEIKVPTTDPVEDNGTEKEAETEPEIQPVTPDPDVNITPISPTEPNGSEDPDANPDAESDPDSTEAALKEPEMEEEKEEEEEEKKAMCEVEVDASLDDLASRFSCVSEALGSFNAEILELQNQIATFETKVQELEDKLTVYQEKEEKELSAQRQALIDEYSQYLSGDAFDEICQNASNYSVENLEKELLFVAKKANPNFLKVQDGVAFASLRTQESTGIYHILDEYKSKKRNS